MTRAAIGSISGSSAPHPANRPNMCGAMTFKQDLSGGTELWIISSWKETSGVHRLFIDGEFASRGGHRRGRAK